MRVLVLGGCGMQGKAVLYFLSKTEQVDQVICADCHPDNLSTLKSIVDISKVRAVRLDASEKSQLVSLMKQDIDVVIDVLPYQFVKNVFESAIEVGVDLVNTNYAHEVRHLHKAATERGVSIMPECGLDPGIDLVICGHGINQFDQIEALNSYCGGLPEKKACDNPLNYKISWNWDMVLRTQKREAVFIKNGKRLIIPAADQHDNEMIHEIDFPGLGSLEAIPNGNAVFYTDLLGVTKTIRETGRYSLRWPGWCAFWQALKKLQLLSDEKVVGLPCDITPHQFMVKLLEPQLQYKHDEKDLAIMQNVFVGLKGGRKKRMTTSLLIERDLQTGLFAMSLGVGFPASIVALMIVNGDISKKGILSPVTDIPYDLFMEKLGERGIKVDEKTQFEE